MNGPMNDSFHIPIRAAGEPRGIELDANRKALDFWPPFLGAFNRLIESFECQHIEGRLPDETALVRY